MAPLRLIGYWRNDQHPEYPDPADLVDEAWDDDEREQVWWYLLGGTYGRAYMGLSPCRLCGKHNGSGEFTDGVYEWPEGLAHYVREHAVRMPQEFVTHALARLRELESRGSDLSWWLAANRK
jgi:hypothetical protein